MKRLVKGLLCGILMIGMSGCTQGRVDANRSVDLGTSTAYSKQELQEAVRVIEDKFSARFADCVLTRIAYMGDEASKEHGASYTDKESLLFHIDYTTGNYSSATLNPNEEYTDWQIMLVRDDIQGWSIYDAGCGYG